MDDAHHAPLVRRLELGYARMDHVQGHAGHGGHLCRMLAPDPRTDARLAELRRRRLAELAALVGLLLSTCLLLSEPGPAVIP